ncbi:pyridoxal phosphate-dependent transferase [Blastocladiella britannica]|nr:pyridoxal phosphate-dependent transferase [Blastocladiella britannica]
MIRPLINRVARPLLLLPRRLVSTAQTPLIPLYGVPPLEVVRGEGALLYDAAGRDYVDFTAGIAVCALGHADPLVADVLSAQARRLVHVSNLYAHPGASALAAALVASTDRGYLADHASTASEGGDNNVEDSSWTPDRTLSRVFLCNSGTEANEAALKFARAARPRADAYKILSFANAFHGRSLGALSATPNEKYQAPFRPLLPGFSHVPYGDLDAATAALAEGGFCGILVEPVQGEGGIHPAPVGFLEGLRSLADQHQCLLMFDEIQCGLARTGRVWGHHWADVVPDVLTCAKPLGNGFPIGAVLTTDAVSASLNPGYHGTTFGGNPLACAVATHVLARLTDPALLRHVRHAGGHIRARLSRLAARDDAHRALVSAVRGRGLMTGLELRAGDGENKAIGKVVVDKCRDRGLLVCTAGADGNTIRLVPPLITPLEVVDRGMDVLEAVVGEVAAERAAAASSPPASS